ncbi:hypothetical protein [Paraburkholderia sp. ZP32-5]|nr:hypothetical protein [Paraburkholderia sp. ZP32-5]
MSTSFLACFESVIGLVVMLDSRVSDAVVAQLASARVTTIGYQATG